MLHRPQHLSLQALPVGEGGVFDVGLEGGKKFLQGLGALHIFLHEAESGFVALHGGLVLFLHGVADVVAQDEKVDVTFTHAGQVGFGDFFAGGGCALKDPGAGQGDIGFDGFFDGSPFVPQGANHGADEDG